MKTKKMENTACSENVYCNFNQSDNQAKFGTLTNDQPRENNKTYVNVFECDKVSDLQKKDLTYISILETDTQIQAASLVNNNDEHTTGSNPMYITLVTQEMQMLNIDEANADNIGERNPYLTANSDNIDERNTYLTTNLDKIGEMNPYLTANAVNIDERNTYLTVIDANIPEQSEELDRCVNPSSMTNDGNKLHTTKNYQCRIFNHNPPPLLPRPTVTLPSTSSLTVDREVGIKHLGGKNSEECNNVSRGATENIYPIISNRNKHKFHYIWCIVSTLCIVVLVILITGLVMMINGRKVELENEDNVSILKGNHSGNNSHGGNNHHNTFKNVTDEIKSKDIYRQYVKTTPPIITLTNELKPLTMQTIPAGNVLTTQLKPHTIQTIPAGNVLTTQLKPHTNQITPAGNVLTTQPKPHTNQITPAGNVLTTQLKPHTNQATLAGNTLIIKSNSECRNVKMWWKGQIESKPPMNQKQIKCFLFNNKHQRYSCTSKQRDKGMKFIFKFKSITPILYAVKNDLKCLLNLIKRKESVIMTANQNNIYPIHIAAYYGVLDSLKLLVLLGSDVNVLSNHKYTPLHFATVKNQLEAVRILLSCNVDIEAVTNQIMGISSFPYYNKPIILDRFLQKDRKKVAYSGYKNYKALHFAVNQTNINMTTLLLDSGADIEAPIDGGKKSVHIAVIRRSIPMLELLLNRGANINSSDDAGYTPMHTAIMINNMNSLDIVKILVDAGANMEAKQESRGYTPLHQAVFQKKYELVKYLINKGADIEARSNKLYTPLHVAADVSEDKQIILLLLNNSADVTAKTAYGHRPVTIQGKQNWNSLLNLNIFNTLICKHYNIPCSKEIEHLKKIGEL